jgi:DNA processing protein
MDDLLYWVWLSRIFPYGSEKPKKLLDEFGSPKRIYEDKEKDWSSFRFLTPRDIRSLHHTSLKQAEMILNDCKIKGIQAIAYSSALYPDRLRHIFAPPMVLYAKGNLADLDDEVGIAVVGTRKASEYGLRLTGNLCYEIAKAGAVIISGCAEGIDTYAHWGALKAGGRTISVLGCGLDINYPASNRELKQAILKKGALISECAPGERPTRTIFPIRNRILSALSVGVLVTEAPIKSGALITAEHAIEQGKDLFCVPPHDIYDANFGGVTRYLRDGAIPVFSARDVVQEYFSLYPHKLNADMVFAEQIKKTGTAAKYRSASKRPLPKRHSEEAKETKQTVNSFAPKKWDSSLSDQHKKLYDALTEQPQYLDDVAANAGIEIAKASAIATELELFGYAVSYSGHRYAKVSFSE